MGVEEEYFNNIEESMSWYEKSCKIIEENIPDGEETLLSKLRQTYNNVREVLIYLPRY